MLVVGAGVGAMAPPSWLELPRALRTSLRVISLLAGLGITLSVFRRINAALAVAVTGAAALLGVLSYNVAFQLALLTLLAAWPSLEAEPWVAAPRAAPEGTAAHPAAHWTTAAWAVFALSTVATSSVGAAPWNLALMVLALLGATFVVVRGPVPWVVVGLTLVNIVAASLSPNPLVHLLLLIPTLLSVLDEHCLPAAESAEPPIVFYDGVCGLCQSGVQLIVREDRAARLKLAPLQGETARQLVAPNTARATNEAPDSMLVHTGAVTLRDSDSVLFIARRLGGAWRLLEPLSFVPAALRDNIYRFVARNRYAWFGKLDACPVPDASVRARFLP